MRPDRRQFILGITATSLLPGCGAAASSDSLTPEMFGAKGDGQTNDTDAFAALSAHVNARGGGTVVLRPVTYIVGKQRPSKGGKGEFAFTPTDILHFVNCSGDIVIRGNGAVLRCAPGLRYGGFDRSGKALPDSRSNLEVAKRAVPYLGMIHTENCSGTIDISDIELDGNLQSLQLGGRYSKAGWQAGTSGLRLIGSRGAERLTRIHSHHHAQDGIILTSAVDRIAATTLSDSVCEDNGRVACSVTGGRNYSIVHCTLRRSGRASIRSAPAAGVDIEAEGGRTIRNVAFSDCEFSDNSGMALVAGGGDSEGLSFDRCKFIGTDRWAAWPNKPRMRFSQCIFVGSVIHAFGDPDPARAAQFLDCTFKDDPSLSPSGKVYIDRGSIAILPDNRNVKFSRCRFELTAQAGLPLSRGVIYADCTMSQTSPVLSRPNGTYTGTTTITGNADLGGSAIRGTVILNGRQLPRTDSL